MSHVMLAFLLLLQIMQGKTFIILNQCERCADLPIKVTFDGKVIFDGKIKLDLDGKTIEVQSPESGRVIIEIGEVVKEVHLSPLEKCIRIDYMDEHRKGIDPMIRIGVYTFPTCDL